MTKTEKKLQIATFAAGCFWGVEEAFKKLEGVAETSVGYSGGHTPSPTYEQVCSGNTGHAEACQVQFDPQVISYLEILKLFFSIHDPTQKDGQGVDIGTQYRSAIFYHNEEQKDQALRFMELLQNSTYENKEIVTTLEAFDKFWPAEEYHQCYIQKRNQA